MGEKVFCFHWFAWSRMRISCGSIVMVSNDTRTVSSGEIVVTWWRIRLIAGFCIVSRSLPQLRGRLLESSPLGMLARSVCLFVLGFTNPHARMLGSNACLFKSGWSSRVPARREFRNPHGSVRSFFRWEDNCLAVRSVLTCRRTAIKNCRATKKS